MGEYVQYTDSLIDVLNDFSMYIDDIERDLLLNQYRCKGILSEQYIFSITGDMYISHMLYKYMKREKLSLSVSGIMYSNPNAYAYTANALGNLNRHSAGIVIERDRGEYSAVDNIKAFYSLYPHIIIGNMRVKTGRGLLCEYADYYSPLCIPFHSLRFEGDISKSEYPAMRGLGILMPAGNTHIYGALSYNTYDASLDSIGNVHRILQYNIHDDSLSLSRKDNVPEYSALIIAGHKYSYINIGCLYSYFGKYVNDIEGRQSFNASLFGSYSIISYDMAVSSNGGYALSYALKKTYNKEITLKLSYLHMQDYFNAHCKFASADTINNATVSIRFHKPLGILYEGIFDMEENDICHYITYYPVSSLNMRLTYGQRENDILLRFRIRSVDNGDIMLFNTLQCNSHMSMIIRNDVKYAFSSLSINAFAYYYHIATDDMMAQYEYTVPGVYALHNLYEGRGLRCGMGIAVNRDKTFAIHAGAVYDTDNSYKLCINAELSI